MSDVGPGIAIALPGRLASGALLTLLLVLAGCGGGEGASREAAETAAASEHVTISGTVHCGPVRECKGEAFLVYTEYGGKVLLVTPTANRSAADIRKQLADGVPVEIAGIKRSRVSVHQYEISADQLTFPPHGPDSTDHERP
jgi:hypothetical protein